MADEVEKTYPESYVKELREEAKKYRLLKNELEEKVESLTKELNKVQAKYEGQILELNEKLKTYEDTLKDFELYKAKATDYENKLRENLLSVISDEEKRKQIAEKFSDLSQLEVFVNEYKELMKGMAKNQTMDSSSKKQIDVYQERYQQALNNKNSAEALYWKEMIAKLNKS